MGAGSRRVRGVAGTAFVLLSGLGLASAVEAAPGRRAVAPGRVVFPVNGGIPTANAKGGGASQVIGLPGGGAVLVGGGLPGGKGFYAAGLTSTGSLDPSFGSGGVAGVALGRRVAALELLRQADGKLVVVARSTGSGQRRLVIVRLNADGGVDRTFGAGGVASTPVGTSCAGCTPGALTPDGEIILTGEAPGTAGSPGWIVTRLTGAGAIDQAFGHEGTITIPQAATSGYDVAVTGDGGIVGLGVSKLKAAQTSIATVTRLRADGLPDFDFNGGTPEDLPNGSGASAMVVNPDGSVVIGGSSAVFRFTSVGAPDPAFGTRGVARIGALPSTVQLLPSAGGGTLVVGPSERSAGALRAVHVAADGSLDQSMGGSAGTVFRPGFGGGASSIAPTGRLAQDSFTAGPVASRGDGSYLAVGGVSVTRPAGGGATRGIFDFAAAAVTASFTGDTEFGGRAKRLTLSLGIARQSAVLARKNHAITMSLDSSAPGLARVTVKANGRVIAGGVVAILGSGRRDVRVGLTAYGSAVLSSQLGVRLVASASARDLLTGTASAAASGTLR